MITVTFRSIGYDKTRKYRRFVKRTKDGYVWNETTWRGHYDVRQGRADASDIPVEIRKLADARKDEKFAGVAWPEG